VMSNKENGYWENSAKVNFVVKTGKGGDEFNKRAAGIGRRCEDVEDLDKECRDGEGQKQREKIAAVRLVGEFSGVAGLGGADVDVGDEEVAVDDYETVGGEGSRGDESVILLFEVLVDGGDVIEDDEEDMAEIGLDVDGEG
jgi:hypothetical protein